MTFAEGKQVWQPLPQQQREKGGEDGITCWFGIAVRTPKFQRFFILILKYLG
jgi:hypothetical protein